MIKVSTIAIAGGTLIMAAAIGTFMQVDQSDTQTLSPATPVETQVLSLLPEDAESPALLDGKPVELASITLTSSPLPDMSGRITADSDFPAPVLASVSTDDLMSDSADATAQADCIVDLAGEPRAAAMVALTLSAPCQPNARVIFHHENMTFTAVTDAKGEVRVTVPALAEAANFLAMMDDGNGAAFETQVSSLAFYDRSVVQWRGDAGVSIHALEFGADYDSDGHVWAGAPRDAVAAARGQGGFVTRLGDTGIDGANMADVYTFPSGTAKVDGDIDLSVEVAVTELNCGREVTAEVIRVSGAAPSNLHKLDVALPDCDAIGDFLLLKNVVEDLKIAAK